MSNIIIVCSDSSERYFSCCGILALVVLMSFEMLVCGVVEKRKRSLSMSLFWNATIYSFQEMSAQQTVVYFGLKSLIMANQRTEWNYSNITFFYPLF